MFIIIIIMIMMLLLIIVVVSSDLCCDKIDDCDEYGVDVCIVYGVWVKINC